MPEAPEGFVSVAEAAAMLGVSDRTARRMAGQLTDADRVADSGQGRFVRLAAMKSLRGKPGHADSVTGQDAPAMTERTKRGGQVRPDTVTAEKMAALETRAAVAEALATEREGEIMRLYNALEKSQALQLAALGEAAAMRARVDALEQQNRGLLESKEKPLEGDSTNPGVSTPVEGGQTAASEAQAGQNETNTTESMPWWKRLFGVGR